MGHIYTCDYRGNRHLPDIKSMLIKTSSFFTIFLFVIVSIFGGMAVKWYNTVFLKDQNMKKYQHYIDVESYLCTKVSQTKALTK